AAVADPTAQAPADLLAAAGDAGGIGRVAADALGAAAAAGVAGGAVAAREDAAAAVADLPAVAPAGDRAGGHLAGRPIDPTRVRPVRRHRRIGLAPVPTFVGAAGPALARRRRRHHR